MYVATFVQLTPSKALLKSDILTIFFPPTLMPRSSATYRTPSLFTHLQAGAMDRYMIISMPRRSIALAAGALLAATGSFAQASSANPIPNLKFEHYRLPNGMKVIFYVDRRAPVVH